MKFYRYRCTVRHDNGVIRITVVCASAQIAREIVMSAERCPRRSITATKNMGRIA